MNEVHPLLVFLQRRQAAPVLELSEKAFGEGRRLPIAQGFRY